LSGLKIAAAQPIPVKRAFQVRLLRGWIDFMLCGEAPLFPCSQFDSDLIGNLLRNRQLSLDEAAKTETDLHLTTLDENASLDE